MAGTLGRRGHRVRPPSAGPDRDASRQTTWRFAAHRVHLPLVWITDDDTAATGLLEDIGFVGPPPPQRPLRHPVRAAKNPRRSSTRIPGSYRADRKSVV